MAPEYAPIERAYTRALSILGIVSPGTRTLAAPLTVQNVQLLGDLSDVAEPHSNPIFGAFLVHTAVAVRQSIITLQATTRAIRVRQVHISTGTTVAWSVMQLDPIDTVVGTAAAAAIAPLGPFGATSATAPFQTSTAIARTGNNAAVNLPASAPVPAQVQFDVRPPLLVAPSGFIAFEDSTANTALTLMIIWEEIPAQIEVADIGFPTTL